MASSPKTSAHYEALGRLGQGAYGVVWKAREHTSGGVVAFKKLYCVPRNEKVSAEKCAYACVGPARLTAVAGSGRRCARRGVGAVVTNCAGCDIAGARQPFKGGCHPQLRASPEHRELASRLPECERQGEEGGAEAEKNLAWPHTTCYYIGHGMV